MRHFTMKILTFLSLLGAALHGAAAVTHPLKYFITASSGVPNFPEFVAVGLVDEVQMMHFDSNTKKIELTQDWMNRITADDPQLWARLTQSFLIYQQIFKVNIETLKQRFNQTGDVHVYQSLYGCEWDNETGEVNGVWQIGYDGEDFISFDLQTKTWITPKPQAVIFKHRLDNNNAYVDNWKEYLTQGCPARLKNFLHYGRSSLERTVLPSVSLLQKTPSSPVSCHATGFYPDRAALFWRKDGEEIHEEVDRGEILPNQDGTFQMRVDLNLSSVRNEDWRRYDCVFQLAGVKDDIVTKLEEAKIRTNWVKPDHKAALIIAAVVVVAVVLTATAIFIIYKKEKANTPPSPLDKNIEISQQLNPELNVQEEDEAEDMEG